jgi:hypothetical protein
MLVCLSPKTGSCGECVKGATDCETMKKFPSESISHAIESCRYRSLVVNRDMLADTIGRIEVPVLRLVRKSLDIVCSPSDLGLEYTAISHVYESHKRHFGV